MIDTVIKINNIIISFQIKKEHNCINIYYVDQNNREKACSFKIYEKIYEDVPQQFPRIWQLANKISGQDGYIRAIIANYIMSSINFSKLEN